MLYDITYHVLCVEHMLKPLDLYSTWIGFIQPSFN